MRRLHLPAIAAVIAGMGTTACSGPPEFEYTCNGPGRAATAQLVAELAAMPGLRNPALADSCDSGDPLGVSFDVVDEPALTRHLAETTTCTSPTVTPEDDTETGFVCSFTAGDGWLALFHETGRVTGSAGLRPPD